VWRPSLSVVAVLVWARVAGAEPALDYMLNCQGCHRADGAGTPGSVPALAGSVARFLGVPGGREYLVRVPGVSQAGLDDAALAAVLNWMVARFDREHLPANFAPYTSAEVAALRKQPLTDVERARSELLTHARRASP
jgi:mono/diheme cytochrome c family protein